SHEEEYRQYVAAKNVSYVEPSCWIGHAHGRPGVTLRRACESSLQKRVSVQGRDHGVEGRADISARGAVLYLGAARAQHVRYEGRLGKGFRQGLQHTPDLETAAQRQDLDHNSQLGRYLRARLSRPEGRWSDGNRGAARPARHSRRLLPEADLFGRENRRQGLVRRRRFARPRQGQGRQISLVAARLQGQNARGISHIPVAHVWGIRVLARLLQGPEATQRAGEGDGADAHLSARQEGGRQAHAVPRCVFDAGQYAVPHRRQRFRYVEPLYPA